MPAREEEYSTLGEFEEQAEMIRLFGREVIPASTIEKPPSAELADGQVMDLSIDLKIGDSEAK